MSASVHRTLISVDELRRLDSATTVLLDCSFDLADPAAGERIWRAGHLPGSVHVDLDRDLCGAKTGRNGRHPLPERAAFAATLGRLGVAPGTQVVAFDRGDGMFAARLWWLLRWMGHDAVAVLDGGVAAFVAAGGVLSTDAVAPIAAAPYRDAPPRVGTLDADALTHRLGRVALIDARAPERFRGDIEPLDAAAGHIPGALNRYFKRNLAADGHFKPAAELQREFEALLGRRVASDVVHQCGSGVSACHNLLAMAHAGLEGALLYPGSWSEWSADPLRPVATGG